MCSTFLILICALFSWCAVGRGGSPHGALHAVRKKKQKALARNVEWGDALLVDASPLRVRLEKGKAADGNV
jgi:hypothetical protein